MKMTLSVRILAAVAIALVALGADAHPVTAADVASTTPIDDALAAPQPAPEAAPVGAPRLATWPVSGSITSHFAARTGGFHDGLDIAAPMYTPIAAAAAGVVVMVGKPYLAFGDTGSVVAIYHGGGFYTLYAHLDDAVRPPVVRAGDHVRAGQVIAYVGLTGYTTGPHLHFGVKLGAHLIDPLSVLP